MNSSDDPIIFFLCLLAVLCHVFLVAVLALGSTASFSPAARVRRRAVFRALGPVAAPFALAVAAVTMSGSLYLSEVKHYVPCHLCWIQRTLLYPQVVWAAVLTFRPSIGWVRRLGVAMLMIDIPVSIYHSLLQKYPSLETSSCHFSNPCTQRFIDMFGYLSEPRLALTAALTILTLLLIQKSIPVTELVIWTLTAIVVLCILLFVNSSAWSISALPIIVFIALQLRDRKSSKPALS